MMSHMRNKLIIQQIFTVVKTYFSNVFLAALKMADCIFRDGQIAARRGIFSVCETCGFSDTDCFK